MTRVTGINKMQKDLTMLERETSSFQREQTGFQIFFSKIYRLSDNILSLILAELIKQDLFQAYSLSSQASLDQTF